MFMNKLISVVIASFILVSCGKETVIREVLVTLPPNTVEETTTTTTKYVPPSRNKFDEYLYDLKEYSGQANTLDDSFLIEFGSTVCSAFDKGVSLNEVVELLSEYSSGDYDDKLYAGIIMSAVVNICPEHRALVESQL
jgi:hypothetical protein